MTPLEEKLYDLLQPILGMELILMDQNKPRPPFPYAAYKVKSPQTVKGDHYSDVTNLGLQTVAGDREAVVSVQVYGKLALDTLQVLINRLRLVTVIDTFRAKDLAAFKTSAVMDISVERETQIERRANLDIWIRYRSVLDDNVGVIEQAVATGTVDGVVVEGSTA